MGIIDGTLFKIKNLKNLFKFSKNEINSPQKRRENFFSPVKEGIHVDIEAGNNAEVFVPILIQDPKTGDYFGADYLQSPEEFKKRLKEQFQEKKPIALEGEKPQKNKTINIVDNDFLERLEEFKQFYFSKDPLLDKVLPYITKSDLKSVLKLSGFAKNKFDKADREGGQKIKDDIGQQYGRWGRRICNLYIRGYLTNMIKEYLTKVLEDSCLSEKEKSEKITIIFKQAIEFWKYVHFVHSGTSIEETATEISGLIELNVEYIALHAAGANNIAIAEKIYGQIDLDKARENGYQIIPNKEMSKAECLVFDLFIMKPK